MKPRVVLVGGSALLAVSLGVSGCGGGGIEEGVPQDTKQGVPLNTMKTSLAPGQKQAPPPKVEMPPATGTEEKK